MKNILLVIFSVFIISLQPAISASWVKVDDNLFIDIDSIRVFVDENNNPDLNSRIFWVKFLNNNSNYFKSLENQYHTKISYVLTQYIINTYKNSYTIKSSTYYDAESDVVSTNSNYRYNLEWMDIVPESVGELLLDAVEHKRQLKKLYKQQQLN